MQDVRVRLSTMIAVTAVVSAGAFAAGRSTGSSAPIIVQAEPTAHAGHDHPIEDDPPLPPNHPPLQGGGDLPPGHPQIADNAPPPPATSAAAAPSTGLTWKVPPRWQVAPNTSSMRLATYRVPRAQGDAADADVSVMQAGGGIDANVDRWIGQFGPDAKAKSKRESRKIAGLEVTIVEAEGSYAGMDGKPQDGQALLGAIVSTAEMPHFFKIVGPKKTVQSARAELDALLASMSKSP